MKRPRLVFHVFILALTFTAALVSSSCDNSAGFGFGVDASARWGGAGGGSSTGPGVIIGGPVK